MYETYHVDGDIAESHVLGDSDVAREASETYKIQAWSWPEVQDGLERAATDLKSHTRGIGRVLKPGPLMNAVVLWFIKQPLDVQIEIAQKGKKGLEWLKQTDGLRNLNDLNIDDADANDTTPIHGREVARKKKATHRRRA
jgi:hypothetical protein